MAGHSNQYLKADECKKGKIKLSPLNNKMAECLREKLTEKLPTDGIQLYLALSKHRRYLEDQMNNGDLTEAQFNILLPQNKSTNLEKFDVSLIIKVLFIEEIFGYKRPITDGIAMPTDDSDVANILRIEMTKNMMKNLGETVDQEKFDEIFDLAQPALLHFNITQEEIDEIRYHEEIDEAQFLNKEFPYNLTLPVPNFIGREKHIAEIREKMKMTKDKYGVVVYGLPGVGKTETIRTYCNDHLGKYNSIIWINAESKESMEHCYNDVAIKLQISDVDENGKKRSIKVIIDYVYSVLAVKKADKNTPALFVFDNINNFQDIKEFLPSKLTTNSLIIATTQSQEWDEKIFELIHLPVFGAAMSDQFLEKELEISASEEERCELFKALENHPLALQQAVSYINLNEMSIREFLNMYNSNDWTLPFGEETQKGKSVYKTFSMALNKLKKEYRCSLKLLNILGHLDGKKIEEVLIKKICNNNNLGETIQKLNMLQNYSLINRSKGLTDDKKVVTIHSLVQQTIQSRVKENGETQKCIEILFQLIQDDFSDQKLMKTRGRLMFNHFLHLLLHHKECTLELVIEKCIKDNYCSILYDIFKNFHHQETFIKLCIDLMEQRITKFIETIHISRVKNFLALSFLDIGEYDKAMKLFEKIPQNTSNDLPERVKFSLKVQHNRAMTLQKMGKYKEAQALYLEVKNQQEQREFHSDLLETKHNIASCYRHMGNYNEALGLYSEVEKRQQHILGKSHPDLFTTKHGMAVCLRVMGRYEEAKYLHSEVEKRQQQILGKSHPDLFNTKHNMAVCLRVMGRYKEALDLELEIEKQRTQLLGESHPDLLITKNGRAVCLYYLGLYKEALELYSKVKEQQIQILGESHPVLLNTKCNIARCSQDLGKYQKALDLYSEVEEKQIQILGESHPVLLNTKCNIARCFQDLGKYQKALYLYSEVKEKQIQILGESHPDLLNTKSNIAGCYQDMKMYNEAVELYSKVEKKQIQILGESHPDLLNTKRNIANCFLDMKKYKKARKLYSEVEEQQIQVLGESHPDLLKTKQNKAILCKKGGKYKEALELYSKVKEQQIQVLGESHPHLLKLNHNIANCYYAMKKYKEAQKRYLKLEKQARQLLGEDHRYLFTIKQHIAYCSQNMGKHKEALDLYSEIQQQEIQELEESDPELLKTKRLIENCKKDRIIRCSMQ